MGTTTIGSIASGILIFLCMPMHTQKAFIKACLTGGSETKKVNGKTVKTARFGGYPLKNKRTKKTPLQGWQKMLIGGLIAILLVATIGG